MKDVNYYKEFCTGCGLCQSACGTNLTMNDSGLLEPHLDASDLSFQKKYCPVSGRNLNSMCASKSEWGDYQKIYLGYSMDRVVREKASSGGILTALSSYLLDKGIVDGIIHIGVGRTPMETQVYCSTTGKQVLEHAGSRYIQTSPLKTICDYLKQKKTYAFIGKPCDVMVLRNYLQDKHDYAGTIKYYFSFFCAGMPTLNANKLLLKKMGCDEKDLVSFSYRGNGWPGYATAVTNSQEYTMSYADSWGHVLGRDKHKYCRMCMDGIGLFADISCGDAWYIKNHKPDFTEGEGRNVIFARNQIGLDLLQEAFSAGYIHLEDYKNFNEEIRIIQKYQSERRSTMAAQLFACKLFFRSTPHFKLVGLLKYSKNVPLKGQVRVIWGTTKRILKGRYR